jgi:hypothetical protein
MVCAPTSRFSSTVMRPNSRRPSGDSAMPRCTRCSGDSRWISSPSRRIEPLLIGTLPAMALSVLLLPAPLEPISATSSPLFTRKPTERTASSRR